MYNAGSVTSIAAFEATQMEANTNPRDLQTQGNIFSEILRKLKYNHFE